jgi:hypothetical protein
MRLGMAENVDWAHIGALLARDDDNSQSTFLKAFIKECNSWGTHYQVEMQFARVNHKLTKEEKEQLSMLSYEDEMGKEK